MRPRNVVRLDPAMAAEIMLSDARVERVGLNRILPRRQPEIRFRHKQVQVAGHAANAAITRGHLDVS